MLLPSQQSRIRYELEVWQRHLRLSRRRTDLFRPGQSKFRLLFHHEGPMRRHEIGGDRTEMYPTATTQNLETQGTQQPGLLQRWRSRIPRNEKRR